MISLAELRTALAGGNAAEDLDALVVRELRAGGTTGEVYDEIRTALWPVNVLNEYGDEAAAAFDDTLLAMMGWCAESQSYETVEAEIRREVEGRTVPSLPPVQPVVVSTYSTAQ